MFLTEQEAEERWCPFVRLMFHQHGGAANRWMVSRLPSPSDENREAADVNPGFCRCIASQCMAWRWGWLRVNDDGSTTRTEGFCGLAGSVS